MFVDRVVEHPGRIRLVPVEGEENVYDVERVEGTVEEEGTPLNAANLNTEIKDAISSQVAGQLQSITSAISIDGSNNVKVRNIQCGKVTMTMKKAKTTVKKSVKFPKAFTKVPNIVVTPDTTVPGVVSCSVQDETTTGFTLYMYRATKVDTGVHWIAIL